MTPADDARLRDLVEELLTACALFKTLGDHMAECNYAGTLDNEAIVDAFDAITEAINLLDSLREAAHASTTLPPIPPR